MLLAVLKRQSPRQRYRRPRSCLVDVKAVGAVLTYAMIAQDFATLTGGAGLHTGERRLKYGPFFAQTLYGGWLTLTVGAHRTFKNATF